jgi:hypothetical protein
MLSDGTIAIWSVPRQGCVGTLAEAHFNYWRLAGGKSIKQRGTGLRRKIADDFLEIGLLYDDLLQVDAIRIFIPTLVTRTMVEDCAPLLANPDFAQGIFNEVLSTTRNGVGQPSCVTLTRQTGSIFCRIHCFATSVGGIDPGELEIDPQPDGTLLTVRRAAINVCANILPAEKSYFRLRIRLSGDEKLNPFIKVIPPLDRHLQSGHEEIEYIDFRMNEARTLPPAIEGLMRADRAKGGPIDLKLVAFLTAVPVHSELSASSAPSHKMRLLEKSWDQYVHLDLPVGMAVYHWKREGETVPGPVVGAPARFIPITDFSAFVKLLTRRSSWKIVLIYLGLAFAIGLLGNAMASWIGIGDSPTRVEAKLTIKTDAARAAPEPAQLSPPAAPQVDRAVTPPSGATGDKVGNTL